MAFEFKEVSTITNLGTLKQLAGPGTTLALKEDNLQGDKRIIVYVRKKVNGKEVEERIVCSPRLSQKIRDKEVKLSNLPTFIVSEATTLKGEVINMMTTNSNEVSFKLDDIKEKAYEPHKISPEELIAF